MKKKLITKRRRRGQEMTKTSISMNSDTLADVDKLAKRGHFVNRSAAIESGADLLIVKHRKDLR